MVRLIKGIFFQLSTYYCTTPYLIQRKRLFMAKRFLPVSVWAKEEVIFVFSCIVAVSKGEDVICQLSAKVERGVNQIFRFADHFRCIFPHSSEPICHVDSNHGCIMETFLQNRFKYELQPLYKTCLCWSFSTTGSL